MCKVLETAAAINSIKKQYTEVKARETHVLSHMKNPLSSPQIYLFKTVKPSVKNNKHKFKIYGYFVDT